MISLEKRHWSSKKVCAKEEGQVVELEAGVPLRINLLSFKTYEQTKWLSYI